jgi:membrane protease YdiL (CAAX protease family)
MTATAMPKISQTATPAHLALAGAIVISGLAFVWMSLFTTSEALRGDLLHWLGVPLRMLVLVGVAALWLRWSGEGWRTVGLQAPKSIGKTTLLVIGGYLAIGGAYAILSGVVLPTLGAAPKTVESFSHLTGNTSLYLYLVFVVAWGSAAFGEELVFRGFLQSRLEKTFSSSRASATIALLAQAAIFGALHSYQGLGGAILAGTTGLIIGLVYIGGGRNLWAPILLHGLIDTVSLTAIYFGAAGA